MWCTRITVTRYGWLVALFERGRPPAYYAEGRHHEIVQVLVGRAERLADGLPMDAALAALVDAGFTLTCQLTPPDGGAARRVPKRTRTPSSPTVDQAPQL